MDNSGVARFSYGTGHRQIQLEARHFGEQLIVLICNLNPHVGAVAVAEYDPITRRSSTSVLTRVGHKDDAVATDAAHRISKAMRTAVCVVAGIHVDHANQADIETTVENAHRVVELFLASDFCSSKTAGEVCDETGRCSCS